MESQIIGSDSETGNVHYNAKRSTNISSAKQHPFTQSLVPNALDFVHRLILHIQWEAKSLSIILYTLLYNRMIKHKIMKLPSNF